MTLRYKLRTLLILLAVLPPLLWVGWTKYEAWRAEQRHIVLLEHQSFRVSVSSGYRFVAAPVELSPVPGEVIPPAP